MKQFATYFTHGIARGAELRRQIYSAKSAGEIVERVDEFFLAAAA